MDRPDARRSKPSRPRATALVVVAPLIRYAAGPLLGPAMLRAAARAAGHDAPTLDLNIRYLAEHLRPSGRTGTSFFVGDHDKDVEAMRLVQEHFVAGLAGYLPVAEAVPGMDPWLTLTAPLEAVHAAAGELACGPEGAWIRSHLAKVARPDLVGVSVLYSGQVVWALAVSIVAHELWPGVPVIWGGPHVTALRVMIEQDARFGRHVEGFVFGHAERTFAALLDAVASGSSWPTAVAKAGAGSTALPDDELGLVPVFTDLGLYGSPRVTLPIQTSRGCSYGQCAFCTYPAIEGTYRPGSLACIEPVVLLAQEVGGCVSVKDSLVTTERIEAIGALVRARARWSACTKLDPRLPGLLARLAAQGLDTLELGVETVHPDAQRLLRKRQSLDLLGRTLAAAAAAGVGVVINLLFGIPGIDPAEEAAWEQRILEVARAVPGLRYTVARSQFQLERLAPLARSAAAHGIEITGAWPWASVLGWTVRAQHDQVARRAAP